MRRHFRAPIGGILALFLATPALVWGQQGGDDDDAEMVLEEVIVTGTSKARQSFFTPFSANQFNEEKLESASYNSQADILRFIPSIKAEGGGGEVASNVFIKGLPSGGQFQFTPLLYDGIPAFATFGLNSSAFDVYYRNDLGIEQMEFVRGGVTNLFGPGSVAGLINYISKTGSDVPENKVQFEFAEQGRFRADYFSGGPLNSDAGIYYATSGYYRYDEGPLDSGLPSEGFQLRGNLRKEFSDGSGSLTLYGQYIDDEVQFFLPFPLDGRTRDRPDGNDGSEVTTLQTNEAANINYLRPNGAYETPIGDGVVTKGGMVGFALEKDLANDWGFNARGKVADYDHEFNLFLDGDGLFNTPETLGGFLEARNLGTLANATYSFTNSGRAVPAGSLLFANRILDRDRPAKDFSIEAAVTKSISTGGADHDFTVGAYFSRTEADDDNVITTYLGEFNDKPRLVDLRVIDVDGSISGIPGAEVLVAANGVLNAGASYSNKTLEARRQALFIADQISTNRWQFDVGVRFEDIKGDISSEGSSVFVVEQNIPLGPNQVLSSNLTNVAFGNGSFTVGGVDETEWAAAVGALYNVNDDWNVYGNLSRGFFFPELRGVRFNEFGEPSSYNGEIIIQGEVGAKFAGNRFSGSAALFYAELTERASVDFVNDGMGGVIERVSLQDTETLGLELQGSFDINDFFTVDGNFTYQDHEQTRNQTNPSFEGNELRRQPNVLANAGLYYRNEQFDAALFGTYVGKNFANDSNTVELDSFVIFRVEAGYTFQFGDDSKVRASLGVFNLFDDETATEGSPRQGSAQSATGDFFVGRPILPRRVTLRLSYSF